MSTTLKTLVTICAAFAASSVIALSGLPCAHAQRTSQAAEAAAPLFSYTTMSRADLPADMQAQLQAYEADPSSGAVSFIKINEDILKTADRVSLNIGGRTVVLDNVATEQRAPNDYSFIARSSETPPSGVPDDAMLVVKGNDVVGTIHAGGKLYRVRPLGQEQALIEVDQAALPPDEPPEFEQLEDGSSAMPLRDMQRAAGTADACNDYKAIVAYTPTAKAQAGNIAALIQLAIDETNQGYTHSQINTHIALAHSYQTSYTESGSMATDRDRFRINGDGQMDEVHALRDAHHADVAVLITGNGDYCGIAAAIGATADTAFAVVGQNCATGYYSFAHEIGHLQGARHNPEANSTSSPFAYGHGYYYQPGNWRTIMSYACPSGCTRLNYWSNPNVAYGAVAMGTAATHNNARVLNETACTVANFRMDATTASGPLAFGTILANGAKASGTNNWSSAYNATYKRYEISVNAESYYYLKYSTAVTPAGDIRFCKTDSVGGKLLITCHGSNGNPTTSRFAFVIYKK